MYIVYLDKWMQESCVRAEKVIAAMKVVVTTNGRGYKWLQDCSHKWLRLQKVASTSGCGYNSGYKIFLTLYSNED